MMNTTMEPKFANKFRTNYYRSGLHGPITHLNFAKCFATTVIIVNINRELGVFVLRVSLQFTYTVSYDSVKFLRIIFINHGGYS